MKVTKLHFNNYRNLKEATIIPDSEVNIIYGDNAQGKTNLLEAIWLFTGNKSFRSTKDSDLICFDKRSAELDLGFFSQGRERTMGLKFSTEGKKVCLNSVPKTSVAAFLGVFSAVVFFPDHLALVKGSPADRRKFLDSAIYQIRPSYAKVIANYNKILVQRNALIKDIYSHSELLDTLEIWDEKLAKYAGQIIARRIEYIDNLSDTSGVFYSGISRQKEDLTVSYDSVFFKKGSIDEQQISQEVLKRLRSSRREDIKYGFTTIGPHRDDMGFFLNGKSAKSFASQGQQRSIVLSIKLAEATIQKQKTDDCPIVLLDDIMSELDLFRQDYILNSISGWQVFITCCEASTVMRMLRGKAFRVNNGEIFQN